MIEQTILGALVSNEAYVRKTIPFLKEEYFGDYSEKILFNLISDHIDKYNTLPTRDILRISLADSTKLNETQASDIDKMITSLHYDQATDGDWLLDQTEKFCQDKAVYNAVKESIMVLDGHNKTLDRGAIPTLLSDALSVSFDTNIGHDFLNDFQERYDFYHTKENKIEFDIEMLNKITKGGVSRKSLCMILAGTGVGKSLAMCHFAAANLMHGQNVLYITMEMAEEKIAERIDANLLDLTIDDLHEIPRDVYAGRVNGVMKRTNGRLKIKEYPTGSANVNHFRFLLNELKLKQKFVPDIIYVDYLNICASSRVKMSGSVNTYTFVKSIAEELRGLAVEFNVPVFSATQSNREAQTASDIDLTNTSESIGLPQTADFMIALISTEELEQLGQLMIKQLKNRWGDPATHRRFVVGIDRSKMRLFDCDDPEGGMVDDRPVMSKTSFGARDEAEISFGTGKAKRQAFGSFS